MALIVTDYGKNPDDLKRPQVVIELPNHGNYEITVNFKKGTFKSDKQLEFPYSYHSLRYNFGPTQSDKNSETSLDDFLQPELPFDLTKARLPSSNSQNAKDPLVYRALGKLIGAYQTLGGDVDQLLGFYQKLGGEPDKLPRDLKELILVNSILNPTSESSYSPWQQIVAAGLAMGTYASATPAIARTQETSNPATDENLRLYNYAIPAGKVIVPRLGVSFVPELGSFKLRLVDSSEMIEEHTALVRLAKDGLEYTVHKPIPNNFYGNGYKVDSGIIPYDKIEQVKREIEEKERKKPKWKKALGTFFIKTTPDSDDFKRDIIRQMQQFAFDDFITMGYAQAIPSDFKLPYSVMEHLLPNVESPQIPQRPKKLEDMLTDGYVELKQGTFYYKKAEDGLIQYRWLTGNAIEKEGVLNLQRPTSLQQAIATGIVNSVRHKLQIEAEQYQERIKKFSDEYKGFILSVAPYVNKDELEQINFGLIAQGFVPVFVESDRVLGVQFSGRYAKVSNGDNVLEGALGVVVNQATAQFSVFYQHRYDVRSDAHFGAVAVALALQTGDVTIDFYVNQPVTGRQKIKSERTTADTTSTTTSSGNTVTRTTRLETLITEYEEVRRVLSLNLEYDFRNNPVEVLRTLKLRGGVVWYSGRDNETTESGNVKKTIEGYSDELKAALGFTYIFDELSKRLDQRIEAYGDIRVGQGKPQFEAGVRTWFGENYRDYLKRKGKGGIDLYRLARILDLQKGRFKVKKETTTKSPEITSGACPTTGTEGVLYECPIDFSGSTISIVIGPSFLSLEEITATSAKYRGTPPFDGGAGTYNVKLKIRSAIGLDTFREYTLTISDVNRNPTLNSIGNKTVNENSLLEFIVSGSDPDNDSLTFSASNLPSGATFNASTRTYSWTPTFTQSGTYTPTFSVTDSKATVSETITITVNNVNRTPTANAGSDQTVNEGVQVTLDSTASSDPDGDALTRQWTQTAGPAVTLSSSTASQPTFTAPQVGAQTTLTFSLKVNDGTVDSTADTVNIIVNDTGGGGGPEI